MPQVLYDTNLLFLHQRALSALDTSSPAPLTPACIAPRLQAAWDSLARVQAALPQLALTGARPDPVRDTLRDCLVSTSVGVTISL
ncbi:hypothetical protein JYU34_005486 [Plutella xylostella]|uniref:PIN domain-containing protein n=1 Tax=Plutella xylostella TaxID=51655 RepID=A0ABQ7QWS4_PLUXY|nr:hypothetical protein JYU34_005486 [Plutella xylostella]